MAFKANDWRSSTQVMNSRRGQTVTFVLGVLLSLPLMVLFRWGEDYSLSRIPVGGVACILVSLFYLLFSKPIILSRRFSGSLPSLIISFFIVSSISVLVGIMRYGHLSGLISFTYQVGVMCFFLVGFLLLQRGSDIVIFFRGIVISAGLSCLVVIIYILQSIPFIDVRRLHSDREMMGTVFGWPNAYGCFLAIALMFDLSLLSMAPKTSVKLFYTIFAAIFATGILLTFSRSAFLIASISFLIWVFKKSGLVKRIVSLGLATSVGLAAVMLFPDLPDQMLYTGTLEVRLTYLDHILGDIDAMDLLVGHGYVDIYVITAKRSAEMFVAGLRFEEMSTHDEYLTILLKTGIVGLAIFCVILFMVLRKTLQVSTRSNDYIVRNVFMHWHCVLVPLLLSLFVMENLRYWPIGMIFWMLSGSLLNWRTPSSNHLVSRRSPEKSHLK